MTWATRTDTSAFRRWFKAQYGRLPNEAARQRLQEQAASAEIALDVARAKLELENRLAQKWQACLYAWNASK